MKTPQEIKNYPWQAMQEGESDRIPCSHWKCQGKSDALTLTRIWDGLIYNCYRCGTKGKVRAYNSPSLAKLKLQRMRSNRKIDIQEDYRGFTLPNDFINLVLTKQDCIHERAYIYKYELDDGDIVEHNIGYSRKNQSIVYPIYDKLNGKYELIGYQERYNYFNRNGITSLDELIQDKKNKNNNKYNTVFNKYIINKYYNNNKIYYLINNNNRNKNKLIITEDILSAIKVYKVTGFNSIALLNSSVVAETIHKVSPYDKVFLWLDFDQRTTVLKKIKYMKSWGINAKLICTEEDPKAVPIDKIKDIFKDE